MDDARAMKVVGKLLLGAGASLWLAACLSCSSAGGRLRCHAVPVPGGYGYVVLHRADTLIKQPYVPAIGCRQPFRTKQEALEVGRLVCRKLREGKAPAVTPEEVEECLRQAGH